MEKLVNFVLRAFALAAIWLASGGCGGNMPMPPAPPPTPSISTISPTVVFRPFGLATAFDLTVNGANFESSSIITWNGGFHSTSFVNDGRLTAFIDLTDVGQVLKTPCGVTTSCVVTIDVVNSSGVHSNAVTLNIAELPP